MKLEVLCPSAAEGPRCLEAARPWPRGRAPLQALGRAQHGGPQAVSGVEEDDVGHGGHTRVAAPTA
jgi:hypothetical protein